MSLFKRKSKPAMDAPAAAERLRTEILVAVGRAEAYGVGAGAIANVLKEIIGAQEYIDASRRRAQATTRR
jgi:stage V sporulation protein SpoVS